MTTSAPRCIVRPAHSDDAAAAVAVLRASITACTRDHQDDPSTLARWLENKTVDTFRSWLESAHNLILVAEDHGVLTGVGLLANDGYIRLCYVEPSRQGRGVARCQQASVPTRYADRPYASQFDRRIPDGPNRR